jgi:hypothetical protein
MSEKVDKIKKNIMEKHAAFYDAVYGLSVPDLKKNILTYSKYLQEVIFTIKTNKEIKAAESALSSAKKPYQDKIKELNEKIKQLKGFVDDSICVPDLENQMIINSMEVEEQKIKMDNCPKVRNAKANLDEIKGPFTDAKKTHEIKISYLNILISEKEGFEPGYRDGEVVGE